MHRRLKIFGGRFGWVFRSIVNGGCPGCRHRDSVGPAGRPEGDTRSRCPGVGAVPRRCDASLLSDGTLRVLAIAAAMLSAPEGSLVVIEEIDNGVHPGRARHLLAQIRHIAEQRQLRVLLSTHNPALLDALPDDAVLDVVFCYRDPQDGSSRLARLSDVPDYSERLAQGRLGHLLTSGIMDRFIKHNPGPQGRKQQALQWLEQQT